MNLFRLTLSSVLLFATSPAVHAGGGVAVCNQPFSYVSGHQRVIHHAPRHVVKRQVVHSKQYAGNVQHHNQYKQGDVVGALQEIARQQQDHRAMIDGLNALGFASTYQSQTQTFQQQAPPVQYAPYAAAPYQQGTTAYSVRNVEVDAFGPQDVRELMASVARYSSDANVGANQLMSEANEITKKITSSVQANSEAALRVATIEAETRGVEATAKALAEALRAARSTPPVQAEPQSRSRVRIESRSEQSSSGSGYQQAPPDPQPQTSASPVAMLKTHCASCHGSNKADPPGGFRVSWRLSADDVDRAVEAVVSGSMPPESELSTDEKMRVVAELQQLAR